MTIPHLMFHYPRNMLPAAVQAPDPPRCLCGQPPHDGPVGTCPEYEPDDGSWGPQPLPLSNPMFWTDRNPVREPQPGCIHSHDWERR